MKEAMSPETERKVELPAPTAWPLVFAFGLALLAAGMATSPYVAVLGGVLALAGVVGWFRDLYPHAAHEAVRVEADVPTVQTARPNVERIPLAPGVQRAWLPLETYPVSAGIKGGLAGSVAMALLAMLYGVLSHHGIFYPINLLSAGFFPSAMTETASQLEAFQLAPFLIAVGIHLTTSLVVGILYGAMLPMLPHRPILLGGVLAPVVWSGLLHGILGFINPVLDAHVDWPWFVASQVGFGLVAGVVVSRQQRIPTWQGMSFAMRAGIESPGVMGEGRRRREKKP
jgi:hypothetical protein